MGGRMRDVTGQSFGRLTAQEPTMRRVARSVVWQCVCTCGRIVFVPVSYLTKGTTRSCGCLRHEAAVAQGKRYAALFKAARMRTLTKRGIRASHLKAGGTQRAKALLRRLEGGKA